MEYQLPLKLVWDRRTQRHVEICQLLFRDAVEAGWDGTFGCELTDENIRKAWGYLKERGFSH